MIAFKSIVFYDFHQIPNETILENNSQNLKINFKYNTTPTIKINFMDSLGLKGTFRLEFLYFQGFKDAVPTFSHENIKFPVELHVVFSNTKCKDFSKSLNKENEIIIMAFGIKVKINNFIIVKETNKFNFFFF